MAVGMHRWPIAVMPVDGVMVMAEVGRTVLSCRVSHRSGRCSIASRVIFLSAEIQIKK